MDGVLVQGRSVCVVDDVNRCLDAGRHRLRQRGLLPTQVGRGDQTFSGVDDGRVGTRGRVLDRVGFKVQGLEALCQRLQGRSDVRLDRPCQREASGVVRAQLTDPWGTVIELTEGGATN